MSWSPTVDTTWQWQLEGDLNSSYDVDVYDIDLFDTTRAVIEQLHSEGRKVVCYFSAGSHEDWRDDVGSVDPDAIAEPLDGWEDERWFDVTDPSVRSVMEGRLDLAARKGCDGVEPDNVDAYDNESGLSLSRDDQIDFNSWLAAEARRRDLAVGLKNSLDLIPELVDQFDFAVNEECWANDECGELALFTEAGKPVFHAEYDRAMIDGGFDGCAWARAQNIRTLVLPIDLDDTFRVSCDE